MHQGTQIIYQLRKKATSEFQNRRAKPQRNSSKDRINWRKHTQKKCRNKTKQTLFLPHHEAPLQLTNQIP